MSTSASPSRRPVGSRIRRADFLPDLGSVSMRLWMSESSISPQRCLFRGSVSVRTAAGCISTATALSKPAAAKPRSKPPAPVKRLIVLGFAMAVLGITERDRPPGQVCAGCAGALSRERTKRAARRLRGSCATACHQRDTLGWTVSRSARSRSRLGASGWRLTFSFSMTRT